MTTYRCPRCHYETERKPNIRRHYTRKIKCKTRHSRKSIEECLNELDTYKKNEISFLRNEVKHLSNIIDNKLYEEKTKKNYIKEFIYLVQPREFIDSRVYKIGKTINPKQRLTSYPKGSKIILIVPCEDCSMEEKKLIEIFKEKFIHKDIFGHEYFEGDGMTMTKTIMSSLT